MDVAAIIAALHAELPDAACEALASTDRPTFAVPRERWLDAARVLRDAPALRFTLTDVTAVDRWPGEPRFEVVYHLLAIDHPALLRVKVLAPRDDPHVPTVCGVWTSANWLEREVWDLFGVVFDGHPDLRRLMMPEDWEGHPLRKDYPVQIKMTPKVYAPLQMTEQEFQAQIIADRGVRGASKKDV